VPRLTFNIKYARGGNQLLSAADIRKNFLWGINLEKYGNSMGDDVLDYHIQAAITQFENFLQLKFSKQIVRENKEFIGSEWRSWGYIKTSYPVVCPISLIGMLGTVQQVEYPKTWMSTKKTTDGRYERMLHLVPNTNSSNSELVVYNGILPNINYFSSSQIPNYWEVSYVTGFDQLPFDLANAIGKLATINIMSAAGDGLLFAPGIGSTSISLDGLSQSLSSSANASAGVFGARIKQYTEELKEEKQRLYDQYAAIVWGVM
jgi:hypothetical protein